MTPVLRGHAIARFVPQLGQRMRHEKTMLMITAVPTNTPIAKPSDHRAIIAASTIGTTITRKNASND
jgi:hypothetical protein